MTLHPAMAAMWTAVFILSSLSVTCVSCQYVTTLRNCPSYVAENTNNDACVCNYMGPGNLLDSLRIQWTDQASAKSPPSTLRLESVTRGDDGKQYTCEVTGIPGQTVTPSVFTLHVASSSPLRLESVTRGDDGKQYTCQVTGIPGQTVAPSVFILHVAYGPSEGNVNISQSRVDPTASNGGVTSFELNCSASDVSPPPRFSWTGLTCANNNHHTCVFTPDPATPDPRNATCTVSPTGGVTGPGIATVSKTIQLDLKYPPGKPFIQPQPQPESSTQPLKVGDALTCTVSGGQPLVQSVLFTCTNPQLNDGDDQSNVTTRTVSSSVTVTSTNAMDTNMTCLCNATWGTGGDVYWMSSASNYTVEHRAVITNLTLDGVENTLTVNLTSSPEPRAVELRCKTYGRPAPYSVNLTHLDGDMIRLNPSNTSTGQFSKETSFTLTNITCRDFGPYTCTAGNGIGPLASKTVMLDGNCPPEPLSSVVPNVTTESASFDLEAFPVPDTFFITYLGPDLPSRNETDSGPQGDNQTTVTGKAQDAFSVRCQQAAGGPRWRVRCTVTARPLSDTLSGFYSLDVSNAQGSVNVTFHYLNEGKAEEANDSSAGATVFIAAGVSVFICILIIIVLVIVVVLVFRRRRSNTKRNTGDDAGHARGSGNLTSKQDERSPPAVGSIYEFDDDPPTGPERGHAPRPTPKGSDNVAFQPEDPGDGCYAVVNKKKRVIPQPDNEPEEGFYSNMPSTTPAGPAEAPAPSSGSQPDRAGGTNADGLFYTTLVFSEEQRRKAAEPPPARETTDYAHIDFTKKAPICSQ